MIIFGEKRVNKAITLNYVVEKSVTAVENIIADALYVQNGEVVFDGDMQIFTVTGKNVTNMNGRLDKGVYVVKTIDFATKIVVK